MSKKIVKIATGLAIAASLTSGAVVAQAVESQTTFDGIANRMQQSRYFEHQPKTTSKDSQIRFRRIGGGYTMNVKAQHDTGEQYKEIKGISSGNTQTIPNGTPKGKRTRLIVTNNTWTTVTVSIDGWYKTN